MNSEMVITFECVRREEAHAKLIMAWRNDPETLAMSYHATPKKWPSFFSEFVAEYFSFSDLPPLFAVVNGKRVAFLRCRPVSHPQGIVNRRCCDISINIAPEFRRQGYGKRILQEIQPWVVQQGYHDVYAEIKKENAISKHTFLAAGFHEIEEGIKICFDTGAQVPIFRLMASVAAVTGDGSVLGHDIFVVAEAGSNWRVGSPSEDWTMAQQLIHAAAAAGADAIKFQVYRPETIYVANAGSSDYLAAAGITEDISDLFAHLSMPYEMIPKLSAECKKAGIEFMATPFSSDDFTAVDPFVAIHKIASYEIGHLRLLELVARSRKPVFLSTGAATEDEIAWSLDFLRAHQSGPITVLQCTASYPASSAAMHLQSIAWLKKRFHCSVGLSDHSRHPLCAPIAAVALGATVIEKHITMDNTLPGPDHAFAILPEELKEMIDAIRQATLMLGSEVKVIDPSEEELRSYARRGVQALCPISPGDPFHEGVNISILRPGKRRLGIHPKFIDTIKGKIAKRHIGLGDGIQFGDWE